MKKAAKLKPKYVLYHDGKPMTFDSLKAKYSGCQVYSPYKGALLLIDDKKSAIRWFRALTKEYGYTERHLKADGVYIVKCIPLVIEGPDTNLP